MTAIDIAKDPRLTSLRDKRAKIEEGLEAHRQRVVDHSAAHADALAGREAVDARAILGEVSPADVSSARKTLERTAAALRDDEGVEQAHLSALEQLDAQIAETESTVRAEARTKLEKAHAKAVGALNDLLEQARSANDHVYEVEDAIRALNIEIGPGMAWPELTDAGRYGTWSKAGRDMGLIG